MKHLLILLTVFSSLAFAQEQAPVEPKPQPEVHVFEYDHRCESPLIWGVRLLAGRSAGMTQDMAMNDLAASYQSGRLQNATPEVIDYMLAIIMTVFDPNTDPDNPDDVLKVLRDVESVCLVFLTAPEETKEPDIST